MHEDYPIIKPTKSKKDPLIAADSLMICLASELRYLATAHGARKVSVNDMSIRKIHLVGQNGSAPLSLCGPFLGAPQAVLVMEKLIALGARRLWMLGWCGSISPALRVGGIVLPSCAYPEEGTSKHYPIASIPPYTDKELCNTLEAILKREKISFVRGPVWSTDAPYRETIGKIRKYQKLGAIAVDMELSALATVAHYRGVKFASLLVVSDELFDYVWTPGFSDPRLASHTRAASEIIFEAATSFSKCQELGEA